MLFPKVQCVLLVEEKHVEQEHAFLFVFQFLPDFCVVFSQFRFRFSFAICLSKKGTSARR